MLAAALDLALLVIVVLCSAQLLCSKLPAVPGEPAETESPQLPA
jgi:hypothetical protein